MATADDSMKDVMDKIITLLQNDTNVSNNFTTIGRKVSPRLIDPLMSSELPAIGIAPINRTEQWVTTHKREAVFTIELYAVEEQYIDREDQVDAIIDRIQDVIDAVRGDRLTDNYLSKPIQLVSVDYETIDYGDDNRDFVFVGRITIECRRLFVGT